jgi:hypothetical protein
MSTLHLQSKASCRRAEAFSLSQVTTHEGFLFEFEARAEWGASRTRCTVSITFVASNKEIGQKDSCIQLLTYYSRAILMPNG